MTRTHGTLKLVDDGATWRLDASPHVHMRAKRVFGKLSKAAGGVLTLSCTAETSRDLAWFLDRYPLEMADADRKMLRRQAERHMESLARLEDIVDASYVPREFAMALPARDYQRREAEIHLQRGGLLNADDVGLGKTVAAICALTDHRTLPAVVVAPAHLPGQWARQIARFAPALTTHVIRSCSLYALPKRDNRGPDVVLMSYHKLNDWAKVMAGYAKSVTFDEAQELRHSGTHRYGAAQYLAQAVRFRLALTATPIYNYGDEIFNVLDLLMPGELGTHAEFLQEWCIPVGNGKHRIANPRAFGTFAREQFLMVRHTRKDVQRELPGDGEPIMDVQEIGSDRAALDSVADSAAELARLILESSDRDTRFASAGELDAMLRQATGIAKAPYVADFVRLLVANGEKVLLGGWHRSVYDIWLSKLKDLNPVMYTGTESATEKDRAVQQFTRGTSQVMLMSLRSGIGVDGLQDVCSVAVIGELDWSPAVHTQFVGRIARDGQKNVVIAYVLVSRDGSDPTVAETLGIKTEQSEGIRNPDKEFLDAVPDTSGNRARLLAQRYLAQRGGARLPPLRLAPAAAVPQAGTQQELGLMVDL